MGGSHPLARFSDWFLGAAYAVLTYGARAFSRVAQRGQRAQRIGVARWVGRMCRAREQHRAAWVVGAKKEAASWAAKQILLCAR